MKGRPQVPNTVYILIAVSSRDILLVLCPKVPLGESNPQVLWMETKRKCPSSPSPLASVTHFQILGNNLPCSLRLDSSLLATIVTAKSLPWSSLKISINYFLLYVFFLSFQKEYMLVEKHANYTAVYKVKVLLISSRLTIPTAQRKPAWTEMICTPDFSYSWFWPKLDSYYPILQAFFDINNTSCTSFQISPYKSASFFKTAS